MVKSVKEKVQEVVEGKKKIQNINILLYTGKAITLEDISGHQVGQTWVAVMKGAVTHLFKSSDIESISIEIKE